MTLTRKRVLVAAGMLLAAQVTLASAGSDPKAVAAPDTASTQEQAAYRVVEIRSYNLKPGTRDAFQKLFLERAFPMLRGVQMDVVGYGPSMHDENSYFLMRSFESIDHRQKSEDAFYGSAEWRDGPREAILDLIESYTTVVVELDEATISGLRKLNADKNGT